MEIPSPHAGTVKQVLVKVGDKVSKGAKLAIVELAAAPPAAPEPAAPAVATVAPGGAQSLQTEVVVLGRAGGYTAAFRAADLGKRVVLVERFTTLGGVCLKRRLHPVQDAPACRRGDQRGGRARAHGVRFGRAGDRSGAAAGGQGPRGERSTQSLAQLAKQRKVRVVHGLGRFEHRTGSACRPPTAR